MPSARCLSPSVSGPGFCLHSCCCAGSLRCCDSGPGLSAWRKAVPAPRVLAHRPPLSSPWCLGFPEVWLPPLLCPHPGKAACCPHLQSPFSFAPIAQLAKVTSKHLPHASGVGEVTTEGHQNICVPMRHLQAIENRGLGLGPPSA